MKTKISCGEKLNHIAKRNFKTLEQKFMDSIHTSRVGIIDNEIKILSNIAGMNFIEMKIIKFILPKNK